MKKTTRIFGSLGLAVLLLGLLLVLGSLTGQESASAHIVRPAASAPIFYKQRGKVIIVSLSRQRLSAYQNGRRVFSTAVMTGRDALPTPLGTYHVFAKLSPTTFHSPFPRNSSYWYPPTHISYALEWKPGYFLHDSWWHTVYGAGTNARHYDPVYGWQDGSHGCVSMSLGSAAWLYKWAPVGTTVKIIP